MTKKNYIQTAAAPIYPGKANLEIMECAVNYNKMLKRKILANAPKLEKLVVLDFGAGSGQFTDVFRKSDVSTWAVEMDPKLRSNLESAGVKCCSVEDIEPESVDYIYSINVLEHIPSDSAILATLYSKLRKGGRILIYVPAFNFLWTSMDDAVGHVRRYDKVEIASKMTAAGFVLKNIEFADSAGFFATLIFKKMQNKSGSINKNLIYVFDRLCFPLGRLFDLLLFRSFFGKNLCAVGIKK